MISTMLLAANYRAIGLTVAVLVFLAYVALFVRNMIQAKPELGSELELAANKREYLSDEELEGPKLDRSLSFALVCLGLIAMALPFYWLAEPGRQEGAVEAYDFRFEVFGGRLYTQGAQCVNCHAAGGVGGIAPYVLQDADGQFIANANWTAPALNNVLLRYSEEEVTYILNYGRPGSPMAAWGTPGGGPLTSQNIEEIITYLGTLQVQTLDPIAISESADPEAAATAAAELTTGIRDEVQRSLDDGEFATIGEAVFNLGLFSGYQAGSLSCGRCHTAGWSLGIDVSPNVLDEGVAGCGGGDPSGIGYNLCGGSVLERFPNDTWKLPNTGETHVIESSKVEITLNGGWLPSGGLTGEDGRNYLLGADGETRVQLDEKGVPISDLEDETGAARPFIVIEEGENAGDLAACAFESALWEPGGISANAYPFDPSIPLVLAADAPEGTATTNGFADPPVLDPADLAGNVIEFADGRLGGDCTVVEMPERTSQAHYDFVYSGADAGKGYGRGGQSHAGMMPGFGATLPPSFIQAVVDYERGL
ncbi:MAG: cytochrome c [Acidimicrobiales bacterium]